MPETNINPNNIFQNISSIAPQYCDRCGKKHEHADLEMISSSNNKAMCKLTCKNCGTMYMIQVNSPVDGVLATKRAEFKSEISAKEINKFSGFSEIHSDEIIDIFDALKGVSTIDDFNKYFKK